MIIAKNDVYEYNEICQWNDYGGDDYDDDDDTLYNEIIMTL